MRTRGLFALASLLTTASIIASGRPRRIGAHLIRKQLYKQSSRLIRKIKRGAESRFWAILPQPSKLTTARAVLQSQR